MANYSTLLKTWGDTGTEYPTGYSHLQGEQPVDVWDNFMKYHAIKDLKHLVQLTNKRIETSKGTSGGKPGTPEDSHIYHDTTNEILQYWDSSASSWRELAQADNLTLKNALDANDYGINSVGSLGMAGIFNVNGNDVKDGSDVIYDASTGRFSDADLLGGKSASQLGSDALNNGSLVLESANFNFGSNLDVANNNDGSVTISADSGTDTHTAVSEDGTQIYGSIDEIDFTGHLNVIDDGNGQVRIDPTHTHDSRYLRVSGDNQMSGPLNMGQNEITNVVIDTRTSDPGSPVEGQEWIRTDL